MVGFFGGVNIRNATQFSRRWSSRRRICPGNQLVQLIVHTRHPKVRFPLEGLAQVVQPMLSFPQELDDGEDEVIRLVEGRQYLILRHRDAVFPGRPSLHLDETQPPGSRHPALDIVAELLELTVHRLESQIALHLHDRGARPRGRCLGVR